MSDRWTNDKLKTNCVAFDKHAKEYVLISNGKCTLDHSTSEAYQAAHLDDENKIGGCLYAAHEAVALRPIIEADSVMIAWTYRGVRASDLETVKDDVSQIIKAQFDRALDRAQDRTKKKTDKTQGRSVTFVGRI